MALKIRLRQQGRHNRPFYRIVVADIRSPRDGKYVESLGWYNPFETESDRNLCVYSDRVQYWVEKGAQLSECTEALLKKAAPAIVNRKTEQEIAKKAKLLTKKKARKAKVKA